MSKYLINESPLIVLPTLVQAIGLHEAIILQQVQYWLSNPNVGIVHDGHKWVHNTYQEWQVNFPFWTVEGVRKIIYRLEDLGVLVSAQTSSNPFDKTKSYRIDYEKLDDVVSQYHPHVETDTTSFTDTTSENTNNTASDEKPSSAESVLDGYKQETAGDKLFGNLSPEWQIVAGAKQVKLPDEKESQYMDTANLIAMQGFGINYHLAYGIAYIFMKTRGIVIPQSKIKSQRKVVKEMIEMGVHPDHAMLATQKLMDGGMTVTDLYSISKTAIDMANPVETGYGDYKGAIDGI